MEGDTVGLIGLRWSNIFAVWLMVFLLAFVGIFGAQAMRRAKGAV